MIPSVAGFSRRNAFDSSPPSPSPARGRVTTIPFIGRVTTIPVIASDRRERGNHKARPPRFARGDSVRLLRSFCSLEVASQHSLPVEREGRGQQWSRREAR